VSRRSQRYGQGALGPGRGLSTVLAALVGCAVLAMLIASAGFDPDGVPRPQSVTATPPAMARRTSTVRRTSVARRTSGPHGTVTAPTTAGLQTSATLQALAEPRALATTHPQVRVTHPVPDRVVAGDDPHGDQDIRGDDDDRHPLRTQTIAGDESGVYSPLLPINSDSLTHVPRGWLVSYHRLLSDGRVRSYLMIRPPAATRGPLPLVMVLHGRHMTPSDIERITRLIPIVGRAVYVYPAGYGRSWNAGGCCAIAHAARVDDVAFLEQVLRQVLTTQRDATAHRVYLLGFSNGGRMAYRMACQDPGVFAGVAAVEAVPVYDCDGLAPVPLVIVAQTGDPLLTVATDGRRKTMDHYLEPTVGATVTDWRTMDACRAATEVRHEGEAVVTRYQGCLGAGRVEYDLYRGGRHSWPEGDHDTPSASEFIWSYLDHDVLPPAHRPVTVAAPVTDPASVASTVTPTLAAA
jgi:polyhydroxybutyrate depolymerase